MHPAYVKRAGALENLARHLTSNIRYPDIQSLDDAPILTKSYFRASGNLLRVDATGQFSFSWPSIYHNDNNRLHLFSFNAAREVFTGNISNEEDQLVVDWYNS